MDVRATPATDASTAALAAENERLQAALHAHLEEAEALRRVATLAARHSPPTDVPPRGLSRARQDGAWPAANHPGARAPD